MMTYRKMIFFSTLSTDKQAYSYLHNTPIPGCKFSVISIRWTVVAIIAPVSIYILYTMYRWANGARESTRDRHN